MSRMVRMYLTAAGRDLFKLGISFPVLRFNPEGNKCVAIIRLMPGAADGKNQAMMVSLRP